MQRRLSLLSCTLCGILINYQSFRLYLQVCIKPGCKQVGCKAPASPKQCTYLKRARMLAFCSRKELMKVAPLLQSRAACACVRFCGGAMPTNAMVHGTCCGGEGGGGGDGGRATGEGGENGGGLSPGPPHTVWFSVPGGTEHRV